MKPGIVFLDIDGVLNCEPFLKNRYAEVGHDVFFSSEVEGLASNLQPEKVDRVNRICEEGNAEIVLSTAWVGMFGVETVKEVLQHAGIKAKILGETPKKMSSWRLNEIGWWLERNPDRERFVILEDEHPMEDLEPKTVRTSFEEGILEEHVAEALRILTEHNGTA